jgi:hypothetical protein
MEDRARSFSPYLIRSQGTTANARAMKPTRVEAQGKVRWSYMIYGSRGADGDVDVDEPAESAVNVASRRGRLKERRGKKEKKKSKGSIHYPYSWTATTIQYGYIRLTFPKKGKHAPRMFLNNDWAAWAEDCRLVIFRMSSKSSSKRRRIAM